MNITELLTTPDGAALAAIGGEVAKERPILFSGEMIRKLLANEKSQTRRVVKATRYCSLEGAMPDHESDGRPYLCCNLIGDIGLEHLYCPYGDVGDRLWVRETFAVDYEHGEGSRGAIPPMVYYRADDAATPWPRPPWKPSIFMPRALSRITLEITDVRVERVQSIRDEDFVPEGFPYSPDRYEDGFAHYWEKLNAKRGYGWSTNPWVWVLVFRRVTP